MQDKQLQYITKTIRFPKELVNEIDKQRKGTERSFGAQVKYMIRKYIEIKND